MKFNPIYLIIFFFFFSCNKEQNNWIGIISEVQENLHDIEVINDKMAYAYSYGTGSLYRTDNGATNWQKIYQFDSVYFEQLQFFGDKKGWICGSLNKLYKTEDGGKSWVDLSLKDEDADVLIYGMYFKNVNEGFISVIRRRKVGVKSVIYQTKNGGDSWEQILILDEMILNIEMIGGHIYGSGNNVIIKDIDKADAWSYSFKDETKSVGQIRDMAMSTSDKIVAVSFNGFILEKSSSDWKSTQITKNRLRSILYEGEENWTIVGDSNKQAGKLFTSNDEGLSWKTDPNEYPDIHRISQSANKLWAVGKQGLVMLKDK